MSPLQELIAKHVPLNEMSIWNGRCPFCSEGREGDVFYVYTAHFHCFACGSHGEGIAFLMQLKGISYAEAKKQTNPGGEIDVPT